MNRPRRSLWLLLTGAALLSLAATSALFFFGFRQNRERSALAQRIEGLQGATRIMDEFINREEFSAEDFPKIKALGLYDNHGNLLRGVGPAPPHRQPPPPHAPLSLQQQDNSLIYTRNLRVQGRGPMMPGMGSRRGFPAQDLSPDEMPAFLWLHYKMERPGFLAAGGILPILFFLGILIPALLLVFLIRSLFSLQAEQENQRHLVQLGEAARTLAHDIRNPLGTLKLQTKLLRRKLPETERKDLTIMDEEIDRINSLVERVGDYLRHPAGHPRVFDLRTLAVTAAERFPHPLQLRLPPSTQETPGEIPLEMDPDKLRSILDNLLRNAAESGHPHGEPLEMEIRINPPPAKAARGYAGIIIRDRGNGFPPDQAERLFEPFYTTKNQGSGIGLAVSRRFAEAAGGTLEAANRAQPPGGAEVTLTLPLSPKPINKETQP